MNKVQNCGPVGKMKLRQLNKREPEVSELILRYGDVDPTMIQTEGSVMKTTFKRVLDYYTICFDVAAHYAINILVSYGR